MIDSRTGRFVADVEHRRQRRRTWCTGMARCGHGRMEAIRRIDIATHKVTDIPVAGTTSPSAHGAAWVSSARPRSCASIPTYLTRRTINLPTRDFPADWGGTEHRRRPGGRRRLALGRPGRPVRAQDRSGHRQGRSTPSSCSAPSTSLPTPPARCTSTVSGKYTSSTPPRTPSPGRRTAVQSEITSIAAAGGFVWLTTSADDGVIKLSADTGSRSAPKSPSAEGRRQSSPATERSG